MKNAKRILVIVIALAALGAAGLAYLSREVQSNTPNFRSARVERGDIVSAISSSGTLSAVTTVQVGSQLSGQISELLADFNTEVKQGVLIARIDPQTFEAKVRQAEAEAEVARAAVVTQRAAVERARAELDNSRAVLAGSEAQVVRSRAQAGEANRERERKTALANRGVFSQRDIDKSISDADAADANLRSSEAQVRAQRAQIGSFDAQTRMAEAQLLNALAVVKQREAALLQAQIDLERTYIRAPIDGTVILRNIDLGQTVAASLQAPVLFQIARDLKEMQVLASVDEADVGRVAEGQRVVFTVDAFPSREFEGSVQQVRKSPLVQQNVVTYTVVISAANADLRLLPGMTANVRILIDQRRNVLRIPNTALRFRPPGMAEPAAEPARAGDRQPGGQARGGAPGSPGGRPSPEVMADRLAVALALSESQKDAVRQILSDSRARFAATREMEPEDAQRARQRLRSETRQAIQAALTPEQRVKYDELQQRQEANESRPGRVWIMGTDGKVVAVSIRTGIGDGTHTELMVGDLKEGQEVLVGVAGRSASTGAPTGPRFGFF